MQMIQKIYSKITTSIELYFLDWKTKQSQQNDEIQPDNHKPKHLTIQMGHITFDFNNIDLPPYLLCQKQNLNKLINYLSKQLKYKYSSHKLFRQYRQKQLIIEMLHKNDLILVSKSTQVEYIKSYFYPIQQRRINQGKVYRQIYKLNGQNKDKQLNKQIKDNKSKQKILKDQFIKFKPWRDLQCLFRIQFSQLKFLTLQSHNLSSIQGLTFINMPKIVFIQLSNNSITNINSFSKTNYSAIRVIDFYSNPIIKKSSFYRGNFRKLKEYELDENYDYFPAGRQKDIIKYKQKYKKRRRILQQQMMYLKLNLRKDLYFFVLHEMNQQDDLVRRMYKLKRLQINRNQF